MHLSLFSGSIFNCEANELILIDNLVGCYDSLHHHGYAAGNQCYHPLRYKIAGTNFKYYQFIGLFYLQQRYVADSERYFPLFHKIYIASRPV
jgi:hypothetical protein